MAVFLLSLICCGASVWLGHIDLTFHVASLIVFLFVFVLPGVFNSLLFDPNLSFEHPLEQADSGGSAPY